MSKVSNHEIQSMADEIREQAAQLRILTFLSFIYTADVVNRYLDIEVARYPVSRTGFSILHNLVLHGDFGTLIYINLDDLDFISPFSCDLFNDRFKHFTWTTPHC